MTSILPQQVPLRAARHLTFRSGQSHKASRSSFRALALFAIGQKATSGKRDQKKAQLLEAIVPLNRGASASEAEKEQVEELASELERLNPNKNALASPLISAKWRLLYTTSASILGTSKPPFLRPIGPIYQTIDAVNLTAKNEETWPFFNQVKAELTPETKSRVGVQFKQFKLLGLIPITAPESARGKLDTTYLDDEIRVSRGDRGNLFVLERYEELPEE